MRQYIGARYVPIFFNVNGSNNWLPNYAYEPLTIVTYNNVSYTSSQQVPASVGNPAENPAYWVPTGNYNAFIQGLQNQISTINTDLAKINKKRYIFIGDSFNTAYPTYSITPWPVLLKTAWGLSDNDFYNIASEGSGLVQVGKYGTYKENFDSNKENIADPESITDIIITFAYNDINLNMASVKAAFISLISDIKNYCPNAIIKFALIGNTGNRPEIIAGKYNNLYNALFQNVQNAFFIDNGQYIFENVGLVDSTGHPTQEGHTVLSIIMGYGIINGTANVEWKANLRYSGTTIGNILINNNATTITFNDFVITLGSGTHEFTNNIMTEVIPADSVTIPYGNFIRNSDKNFTIEALITLRNDTYKGYVIIKNGAVNLMFNEDISTNASSASIVPLTFISVNTLQL